MIVEVGIRNKQEPIYLDEYAFVVFCVFIYTEKRKDTYTHYEAQRVYSYYVCVKYGVIGYMT